MPKKICIIDGHPDPSPSRYIHALCNNYSEGAKSAGHLVSRIDIGDHDFEPLKYKSEFEVEPEASVLLERAKLGAACPPLLVPFLNKLGGASFSSRAATMTTNGLSE